MSINGNNSDGNNGGGEIISNKKECTSCEQNNVDNITEDFNRMASMNDMSTCASCGKVDNSDNMNTCNKCKSVKYCNAACKKKHRSKHKKKCERRVAELHDEKLFKEHPPPEECPICMLPILASSQTLFKSCCGKSICTGCIYAMDVRGGKDLCAFCRTPPPSSDEEDVKRTKKLMDKGNAKAFNQLANAYFKGDMGLIQDLTKAHELFLKAGELGCSDGYYNLGVNYDDVNYNDGIRFDIDKERAQHYYEVAAMGGCVQSRNNIGCLEGKAGNHHRAMKHFIIAARAGHKISLENVKTGFMKEFVTKDDYASTLRAYHERQKEMNSETRDKAAASDMFIY